MDNFGSSRDTGRVHRSRGRDAVLERGIELALSEIYEKVKFPAPGLTPLAQTPRSRPHHLSTYILTDASRPPFDDLLWLIADYVLDVPRAAASAEALDTARFCLLDTLGCGLLALT